MNIPQEILEVLDRYQQAGCQADLVGGCVRDLLAGRTPHDYDIAVSARPEQTMALFDKVVPTGIRHGTVTIFYKGRAVEATTFRSDGAYADHRHPEQVHFVSTIEEDLARRDFTINAMAWSPVRGLIDPYGGQADLKAGIIRAVGDPAVRFEEDALRMFRAFRFAARFGFRIEERTRTAIEEKQDLAGTLAVERVRGEITQVLQNNPSYLEDMAGLLGPWIPEIEQMKAVDQDSPYHYTDVLHHTIDALKAAKTDDPIVLWALMLHDTGKIETKQHYNGKDHFKKHEEVSARIARRVVKAMKLERKAVRIIPRLVADHDTFYAPRPASLYKLFVTKGYDDAMLHQLFAVQYGDIMAHRLRDRLEPLRQFERWYEQEKNSTPLSVADLKIDGEDVLKRTALQGKQIARVLDAVLFEAICSPALRDRESQLRLLEKTAKQIESEERA